jgi:hypothetical protein
MQKLLKNPPGVIAIPLHWAAMEAAQKQAKAGTAKQKKDNAAAAKPVPKTKK